MPFSPPPSSSSLSHFIIDSLLSLLLLTLKILIWPSLGFANDTQYLVSQIINANWLLNKAVNLRRRKYFRKLTISYLKRSHEDNLDVGINLFDFSCQLHPRQTWHSDVGHHQTIALCIGFEAL